MSMKEEDRMKRYLIVAHSEGDSRQVDTIIRARMQQGQCRFVVLVPATPASTEYWIWTEEQARLLARHQLDTILATAKARGADVTGCIGDRSPTDAIDDVLRVEHIDKVLLISPPVRPRQTPVTSLISRLRQIAASACGTMRNAQTA
jgi:pentose-5-phosphate-3-epimerase